MACVALCFYAAHHERSVPVGFLDHAHGAYHESGVTLSQAKHLRSHDVQTNHLHVILHSSSHWVMDFVNASRHPRTRTHRIPVQLKVMVREVHWKLLQPNVNFSYVAT